MVSVFLRSAVSYLFLLFSIRCLGKRQLGEMEASELVVSMLVADLAAAPMQDLTMPMQMEIVPILTVLILELLLSALAYRFIFLRKLFCGKPVILMEGGKILADNLKRTRVTPDELTEHLREKGVVDLNTVKFAILETNGQISVLLEPQYDPVAAEDLGIQKGKLDIPITVICNGRLIKENMRLTGKSDQWLEYILKTNQCRISDVLLLTVDASDKIYLSLQKT